MSQSLVSEDGDASLKIPPFFFPFGRPANNNEGSQDSTLKLAKEYLKKSPEEKLKRSDMHAFAKVSLSDVHYHSYLSDT